MKHLKRMVSVLLVLALFLSFGVLAAAETGSGLTITTDPENKTVSIQGTQTLDDPASILILSPSFDGNYENIWDNPGVITGIDQIGTIDVTIPLSAMEKGKYTVSVNKDMIAEQFSFFLNSYTVKTGERIAVPITVWDCQNFAGVVGKVEYDEELLTLEALSPANGFYFLSQGNRFVEANVDGAGVDGDVVVGYALFTAKSGLTDDVSTYVNIKVEEAYGEDGEPTNVKGATAEVVILGIPPMRGDVNLDGTVDLADAIMLLQYLAGNRDLTPKQLKAADVTSDGVIDTADAIVIMQMCL